MGITIQGPSLGKASICEPILRSLPDWFGIEASNQQYLRDIEVFPTLLALIDDNVIGFLTIHQHNPFSAEIHVMGLLKEYHRLGAGRALVEAAEKHLREQGIEYLQVKTLSAAHPDKNYIRTRAFYASVGFRPLEEFPLLWNKENPALQLIKKL